MATRSDNYLSLCLEQASKSPLHYRHGCIIVRGGKVIGSGFNDYRSGFNGGALKTGKLTNHAMDGPALTELKTKLKRKYKSKHKQEEREQQQQPTTVSFTPYETHGSGMGGGPHANDPLTMHSEMMAIQNALATSSSASSSSALSFQKPCWKLPTDSKRKLRLRQEVIAQPDTSRHSEGSRSSEAHASHAQRSRLFKRRNLNHVHLNQVLRGNEKENAVNEKKNACYNKGNYNYNRINYKTDNNALALPLPLSTALDRMEAHTEQQQDQEERGVQQQQQHHHQRSGHHSHRRYQYQYQYDRKQEKQSLKTSIMSTSSNELHLKLGSTPQVSSENDTQKPQRNHMTMSPQSHPMLVPVCQARNSNRAVRQRKKPARLNGADLYVARLGSSRKKAGEPKGQSPLQSKSRRSRSRSCTCADALPEDEAGTADDDSITSSSSPPASLHDELRYPHGRPKPSSPEISTPTSATPQASTANIHASRPCYRCITYMHNVGIKRVFWTNSDGQWEGGKVRDLVDVLDGVGTDEGGGNERALSMFVTKHEVLMLRRVMGARAEMGEAGRGGTGRKKGKG